MSKKMEYKITQTNRKDFENQTILITEENGTSKVEIRPGETYWGPYPLHINKAIGGDLICAEHNSNPTLPGVGECFGAMHNEEGDRLQGYFVNFIGMKQQPQTFWFEAERK